jgi:hypothetical protein
LTDIHLCLKSFLSNDIKKIIKKAFANRYMSEFLYLPHKN